MTFNDNSDFAPLVSSGQEAKITEIEDVERGEDFIQAGVSGSLVLASDVRLTFRRSRSARRRFTSG